MDLCSQRFGFEITLIGDFISKLTRQSAQKTDSKYSSALEKISVVPYIFSKKKKLSIPAKVLTLILALTYL